MESDPRDGSGEEDLLEIKLRCIDGREGVLWVPPDLQVFDFRSLIAEELGVPVERQRLLCQGRSLLDGHMLSHYNMISGCTVHVVVREADARSSADRAEPSGGATFGAAGSTAPPLPPMGVATPHMTTSYTTINGVPAAVMVGHVPVQAGSGPMPGGGPAAPPFFNFMRGQNPSGAPGFSAAPGFPMGAPGFPTGAPVFIPFRASNSSAGNDPLSSIISSAHNQSANVIPAPGPTATPSTAPAPCQQNFSPPVPGEISQIADIIERLEGAAMELRALQGTNASTSAEPQLPWVELSCLVSSLERETGWRSPLSELLPLSAESVERLSIVPLSLFVSFFEETNSILSSLMNQFRFSQHGLVQRNDDRARQLGLFQAQICEINAALSSYILRSTRRNGSFSQPNINTSTDTPVGTQTTSGGSCPPQNPPPQNPPSQNPPPQNPPSQNPPPQNPPPQNPHQMSSGQSPPPNLLGGMSGMMDVIMRQMMGGNSANNPQPVITVAQRDQAVAAMPQVCQNRWRNWTGDSVAFSRSVMPNATVRPFSDAYRQGNPTMTRRERDTHSPDPNTLGLITWQKTLAGEGISENIPVPSDLQEATLAQACVEAVEQAAKNPDYDPSRFLNLAAMAKVVQHCESSK